MGIYCAIQGLARIIAQSPKEVLKNIKEEKRTDDVSIIFLVRNQA
jgi:hypothetical protein